ncbi:Os06g0635800 [Oryza sativa Japonica Group]|uniref:Uncharacterized protein n=3 Tax=Oryza TaxID=4527 RepID=A3BDV2_ORYSJ|nr:hypothetical protein OsJ_22082 [Oryza sativa Japonica Group]BAD37994.1 hypothetical protein [Oryza sativa Japonica Group]BAS98766.1 Os06g0635800 [Oryza sativa Japonica Group]
MTPELATAAATPLPEKRILTAHEVVMATLFPNGIFSYTAGPSHALPPPPPPPPAASDSFFQVVIPPGGVPTNYAVHEALDFDPNIFFADVPDGEQGEPVLLSSMSMLLDVDTSSSLAADDASSSAQAAVDVASLSAQAAVDVPSSSVQAFINVPSSSAQAAIDVPSSSAQAATDVASSLTQGAAGNERPIVFDFDLNEPSSNYE